MDVGVCALGNGGGRLRRDEGTKAEAISTAIDGGREGGGEVVEKSAVSGMGGLLFSLALFV